MAFNPATHRVGSKSPPGFNGVSRTANTNGSHPGALNGHATTFRPSSTTKWLLHDSTPDDAQHRPLIVSSEDYARRHGANGKKTMPSAIGTNNGTGPTHPKVYYTTDVTPGLFLGSHYLRVQVSNNKYNFLFSELEGMFGLEKLVRTLITIPDPDNKKMNAYLLFDDVRHASRIHKDINTIETTADVDYVSRAEFVDAQSAPQARYSNDSTVTATTFYAGQVMFYAKMGGHATSCKVVGLDNQIGALAQHFGDILAFEELETQNGAARFRVEFFSIKAAKEVVKKITASDPTDLGGWLVSTQEFTDHTSPLNSEKGTGVAGRGTPFSNVAGKSSPAFISATGRTAWNAETGMALSTTAGRVSPATFNDGLMPIGSMRDFPTPPPMQLIAGNQQHIGFRHGPVDPHLNTAWNNQIAMRHFSGGDGRPRYSSVSDNSQVVNIDNIREGGDVRTTLMLRNLPNQMTCHKMRDILNSCCFGEYDFFYVRIDYAKGLSVGYGFVNFLSPAAIIKFLETYEGKPWLPNVLNRRAAGRLVEVSYATIQGYDCCVEKFRNSSVMTEFVDYRPKLFLTHDTAPSPDLVGQEVDFPPVNNPSKHQRSLANASVNGLYPPQGRRGLGGQQRYVRSQYDRGTTAQQQEDMLIQIQQRFHKVNMHNGTMTPYGQQGYPMLPASSQHSQSGQLVGLDPAGQGIFGSGGPVMPPNGFYGPDHTNTAPTAPQFATMSGLPGNPNACVTNYPAVTNKFHGHQASARAPAVPRSFPSPNGAGYGPSIYHGGNNQQTGAVVQYVDQERAEGEEATQQHRQQN